ncbi:MAG: hypothetical protein WAW85_12680 [Gordonia sp. (in: high G+C Gram-positive bacteria)]|uniref:hypothetical protein n=1 Tax=Gordonia sp. (in: high G+C Gram-positive bacteria) TaxID=84139 RepID=UPI003BB76132
MRTPAIAAAGLAAAALLAGCGASDNSAAPSTRGADPVATAPANPAATRMDPVDCTTTPPPGQVVRTGYGLDYPAGEMHIGMTPLDGAPPVCVTFAKSGPVDPQVPPDAILFTFAGPGGEGGQIEFEAVALTGGILPHLGNGVIPWVGPLDHPIAARVGLSIDGRYYAGDQCTLLLTQVTQIGASGRFDCPTAALMPGNTFKPDDDVDYNVDDTVPPAPVAALGGWFTLRR